MYLCTQEKKCEQEEGLGYYLKAVTQRTCILFLNSHSLLKQFTSQVFKHKPTGTLYIQIAAVSLKLSRVRAVQKYPYLKSCFSTKM